MRAGHREQADHGSHGEREAGELRIAQHLVGEQRIDGVFDDPTSVGRGVLEFKQGFNGYVEELPGEFTLPVSRVRCAVKRSAQKVIGG